VVARNVTILVNGVEKARTDNSGRYVVNFDKVPGRYEIEPEHVDFFFEPITVDVTDTTFDLPPITATTVYICGTVFIISDSSYIKEPKPREVYMEQLPNPIEE